MEFAKTRRRRLKMPLPRNDAELEVLSFAYFGAFLHLSKLWMPDWSGTVSYEVSELYNSYHGEGFQFSGYSIDGYDHSAMFWGTVIGPLECGGVAGRSYGTARVNGHRQRKRIEHWMKSRQRGRQDSDLRPAFVRLAHSVGVGESIRRGNRPPEIGALTAGREDGAAAVLLAHTKGR